MLRTEADVRNPTRIRAAEYVPSLCTGRIVFNSMRQMNIQLGSTVAIQKLEYGHSVCEPIWLPNRIVAISRDAQKRQFVRGLGAHDYIDSNKEDSLEAALKLGGASLIAATYCPE